MNRRSFIRAASAVVTAPFIAREAINSLATEGESVVPAEWVEEELTPTITLATSEVPPSSDKILVDYGEFYLVNDVVHIPRTGEHMLVTGIDDGCHVSVVRGWGGSAASPIRAGEPLWTIGNAIESHG